MKNMKIRMKLLVSLAVIIVATLVLGITAFVSTGHINNQVNIFAQKAVPNTKYSQQIRLQVEKVQVSMLRALIETDISLISNELKNIDADIAEMNNLISLYKQNASVDKELFVSLENSFKQTANARQQIETLLETNDEEMNMKAYQIYKNDYENALSSVDTALNTILNGQQDVIQKQVEDSNRIKGTVTFAIIVILVVGILIAIFMVITLSRLILTPVNEVLYAMSEMSKGNVHTTLEYESRDEFGEMANSVRSSIETLSDYIDRISNVMHKMSEGDFIIEREKDKEAFKGDFSGIEQSILQFVDKISETMKKVAESSVQVSSGASQVSSGAQALSQGTTEQASSVEELSATITEISNQVSENAQNAGEASQRAAQVGSEASESSKRMKNMLDAMEDISGSSNEIGKIIKTIEDIAFQTNILALNAAVEAARAGTAGKGFAVVADEVRNLASKSAEAAKNTTTLIETSIKAVHNGTEIAGQTADLLSSVVEGSKSIAEVVNKIAADFSWQAEAISQVTEGINQVSSVVQTTTATAEENAASSQELSAQAQILKSLVSKFRLEEEKGFARYQDNSSYQYDDNNSFDMGYDDGFTQNFDKY